MASGTIWPGLEYELNVVMALPYFASGILFGWFYRRRQGRSSRHGNSWLLLALLAIPLLFPRICLGLFGLEHRMWEDPIVFLTVSGVLFVYIFLVPDGRAVANPIGDFLGRISYSFYLLHLPLLLLMKPLVEGAEHDGLLMLPLFLVLATLVSALSYHLIEAPSRKLIRARLGAD